MRHEKDKRRIVDEQVLKRRDMVAKAKLNHFGDILKCGDKNKKRGCGKTFVFDYPSFQHYIETRCIYCGCSVYKNISAPVRVREVNDLWRKKNMNGLVAKK